MTTKSKKKTQPIQEFGITDSVRPYVNPKLRSTMNYNLGDEIRDLEYPDPVSITVPDMNMSLKEILNRHSRGLPIPSINLEPQYSEYEFPDLKRLDLAEIEMLREQNRNDIDHYETQLKEIEAEILRKKNSPEAISKGENPDLPPDLPQHHKDPKVS